MNKYDIPEAEVKKLSNILEFFRNHGNSGITPLSEKVLFQMLEHVLPFYFHVVISDVFNRIYRVTVNKRVLGANKRIHDIKFLKYPPKDKVSNYGRCNMKNQSILYASTMHMIALSEVAPEIGDLITHSVWELKEPNTTLTFCPIFRNQPTDKTTNLWTKSINDEYISHINRYPENMRILIDMLVQFIADSFSKRVRSTNSLDYLFSAFFSDKIFNNLENREIEAIYYPSVKQKLSFENIAIKPEAFDLKYNLVEVRDGVINTVPRISGGYMEQGLSDCKEFDYASGKILWDSNKLFTMPGQLLDFNLRYGVSLE